MIKDTIYNNMHPPAMQFINQLQKKAVRGSPFPSSGVSWILTRNNSSIAFRIRTEVPIYVMIKSGTILMVGGRLKNRIQVQRDDC